MSQDFFFVLPHLVDQGLVADDSRDYAFVAYDRDVITEASRIVVRYLGAPNTDVKERVSKKRVKVLMEFFAVALSMPMSDYELMEVARSWYRKWLEDLSIFGDVKRQNKFLRRIIKQLSLPFALRGSDGEILRTHLLPVLSRILGDFSYLLIERSNIFETETWLAFLNVCLGICNKLADGSLSTHLTREQSAKIKMDAFSMCFDAFMGCGVQEHDIWASFKEYSLKWSLDLEFVRVWSQTMHSLFRKLLIVTYNLPVTEESVAVGSFTKAEITREAVAILLCRVLDALCIDVVRKAPRLMTQIQEAIAETVNTAMNAAAARSKLFKLKFPEASYMKLFGRFLIYMFDTSREYQDALAINVQSCLSILCHFERKDLTIAKRISQWVFAVVGQKHPRVVEAFLQRANDIFQCCSTTWPLVAQHSISLIPSLPTEARERADLVESVVGLFISSMEALKVVGQGQDLVGTAFGAVLNLSTTPRAYFPLLCCMHQIDPVVSDKFFGCLSSALELKPGARDIKCDAAFGAVSYLGYLVIARPEVETIVNENKVVPKIFQFCRNPVLYDKSKYPELVVATMQMALNMIHWTDIFSHEENISELFRFLTHFALLALPEKKSSHKSPRGASRDVFPPLEEACPPAVFGDLKNIAGQLLAALPSRAVLRLPWRDHFSRVLDSSAELSEEFIIKKLGMTKCVTNYYTIGYSTLVSFIENENGEGPMVVFSRNLSGRSVWVIEQDYKGALPTPQLSTEIQKEELPPVDPVKTVPLRCTGDVVDVLDYLKLSELQAQDERVRQKFMKDFTTWLNWDEFGFYYPHNYSAPYQRRRVVDFLTTMGICEPYNKTEVRAHDAGETLFKTIKKLDELDKPEIVPISVVHVLPSDSALGSAETKNRMTPLLKAFMSGMGEPMQIRAESSKLRGLPVFNTTVPSIPFCNGWAILVSSAMLNDADPCKAIESLETPIKIIFNETNFEINHEFEESANEVVIIVKPCTEGLYHVSSANKVTYFQSPFAEKQTMCLNDLAFRIGLYVDMTTSSRKRDNVQRNKRSVISDLCKDKARRDFAECAGGIFK